MEPIDYMLDVQNPIEAAMRGYGLGRADIEQRQVMDMRAAAEARAASEFEMRRAEAERLRADAEEKQARFVEMRDKLAAGEMTTSDFSQWRLENAQTVEEMSAAMGAIEKPKLDALRSSGLSIGTAMLKGNTEVAFRLLDERIAAAEATNTPEAMQEAQALRAIRGSAEIDPQGEGLGLMLDLYSKGLIDDKILDATLEAAGQGVEAADVQSTDYIGGIAVVTTMKDGMVRITDARSGKAVTGQAADDLLAEASDLEARMAGGKAGAAETARLEAQIDLGALASAASAGGAKSVELAAASSDVVSKVRSNLGTLDRAIELVEEEGANTGVIESKLPDWKASTVELKNLQGQLTIDVIGAVTFGALSEGELALAQDIALPTNLDGPELAAWLRRKKAAQEKLAKYHSKKAQFFSDGFSTGQWEEFIESGETDMRAWMDRNVPGPRRRTTTPAPSETTPAAPEGGSDDMAFVQSMQAKNARGETLTTAEQNRLNVIARKGQ
jgi:hypothetical protein